MQLRLRGKNRTIRLDSTLDGFDKVVAHAAREARLHKIAFGSDTVQNLMALGVIDSAEATSVGESGSAP